MNYEPRKNGFSLTEVLIAVGILAVGLIFIAGTFPVGIGLTTVAAERTVGAIAADEAFAKIRLYGVDVSKLETDAMADFNEPGIAFRKLPADANEVFTYPSVVTGLLHSYYWSALCRKIDNDSRLVQVTVFVCRKTGEHTRYPFDDPDVGAFDWPKPVYINNRGLRVTGKELRVHHTEQQKIRFFSAGTTFVTEPKGGIYRVLDYDGVAIVKLDREVQDQDMTAPRTTKVWVVPPAVGGGKNPVIGVYQRVIKF